MHLRVNEAKPLRTNYITRIPRFASCIVIHGAQGTRQTCALFPARSLLQLVRSSSSVLQTVPDLLIALEIALLGSERSSPFKDAFLTHKPMLYRQPEVTSDDLCTALGRFAVPQT